MVDQAIKNKTPVFIMGNIDELELLWETLPQQMVMDVFTRPITVGDMVDNERFLSAEKTHDSGCG